MVANWQLVDVITENQSFVHVRVDWICVFFYLIEIHINNIEFSF